MIRTERYLTQRPIHPCRMSGWISNAQILICTPDGEVVSRIPTQGREYAAAEFHGDYLYVAYANAKLFRYRIEDGKEEGVADISLYINSMGTSAFDFTEDMLYFNIGGRSYGVLSAIRLSDMKRVNQVDDCCGYSPETNRYVVLNRCASDQYQFVSYPQYTVAELRAKGTGMIGSSEMTAEMKARYGLN